MVRVCFGDMYLLQMCDGCLTGPSDADRDKDVALRGYRLARGMHIPAKVRQVRSAAVSYPDQVHVWMLRADDQPPGLRVPLASIMDREVDPAFRVVVVGQRAVPQPGRERALFDTGGWLYSSGWRSRRHRSLDPFFDAARVLLGHVHDAVEDGIVEPARAFEPFGAPYWFVGDAHVSTEEPRECLIQQYGTTGRIL